jgi:hypothetical protein
MNVIFLLIFCLFLNYICAIKCQQIAELYLEKPYQPVYDIVHKNIPRLNLHIPDCLIILATILVSIKYIFFYNDKLREEIDINLYSLLYSYMLRSITIRITIIPACVPKHIIDATYYSKLLIPTHDLMYSGHTIYFICCGKIFEEYYDSNLFFYMGGKTIQFIFPIFILMML